MDNDEGDLSALAWPGFVDILSAVIIMFVFFLLIVATSLYFHMLIFVSKVESKIAAENVKTENNFEFSQIQTQFAESKEQTILDSAEVKGFTVFFGTDSISILPEIKIEMKEKLQSYFEGIDITEYRVNVFASKSEGGVSTMAKKIAVARMLNVRNVIMNSDIDPEFILPKLVKGYEIDEKFHWVRVELVKR